MKEEFFRENGKVYLVKHCSHCDNTLMFHLEEKERRVYGECVECGKSIEVFVPGLAEVKE